MPPQPTNSPATPRRLWLLAALALAAIVIVLAVVSRNRAQQQAAAQNVLAAEIERIRAAGDPLTREQLNAYYRVPADEEDLTDLYLASLRGCEIDHKTVGELPFVGIGEGDSIAIPPQPWPQLQEAEGYLIPFAATLEQLRTLGKQQGGVRFPTNLQYCEPDSVDHIYLTRDANRLLALECACRMHRGEYAAAADCVIALIAVADALRREPSATAQEIRAALWGIAKAQIVFAVRDQSFPTSELKRIQQHVETVSWDDALLLSALGERVAVYEMLHAPLRDTYTNQHLPGTDLRLVLSRSHPQECGVALGLLSDFVDAARRPLSETIAAWPHIEQQVGVALRQHSGPTTLKQDRSLRNAAIPFWAIAQQPRGVMRGAANQRASIVVLAIERFRRETGRVPGALEELVPDYLAAIPSDPCDGNPMRFVKKPEGYAVYSVGLNLADNAGDVQWSSDHTVTDLGLFVPLARQ